LLIALLLGVVAFVLTLIGPAGLGNLGGGMYSGGHSSDSWGGGGGGGFGGGGASGDW